jgi:hypothetical protein
MGCKVSCIYKEGIWHRFAGPPPPLNEMIIDWHEEEE